MCLLVVAAGVVGQARTLVQGSVSERAGVNRSAYLLRQGVPVRAATEAEIRSWRLEMCSGEALPAIIEPEGRDENGKVRWVRLEATITVPAWRTVDLALRHGGTSPAVPVLRKQAINGGWRFITPHYSFEFRNPDQIRLTTRGGLLLAGKLDFQVFSDVHSIIGGGGATTILTPFRPSGFEILEESPARATIIFRGRVPKQKAYSYRKGDIDPALGFECEARFFVNSISATLPFEWRLTNQCGWKSWLERYALLLPVPASFRVAANQAGIRENLGSWVILEDGAARLAVTAPFVFDLGPGSGMRMENGFLLHGGVNMPIDGALTGKVPQVHRWFHYGMSRTFNGALIVGGTTEDAQAEVEPLHLQLPAGYYSELGILPERGDVPTNGEFDDQIARAANWLLENQWRGTLWWGEWWREYDLTRQQGAEEASNGNSALAPVYHYYRTGDGRFLECARRAAFYTYDVQFNRARSGPGPFLHARRHLLDEQDWVHPRYQRLTGALMASHTLLAAAERRELIEALKNYTDKLMDAEGRMHDWDRRSNRPGGPAGVDTSNIMEALVQCWREGGGSSFLEKARRMSRWTISQWRQRKPGSWNWNLSQYVLRGLVAVAEATGDPEVAGAAIEIARDVLAGQSEAELHFAFYNAWMAAELNRAFAADLPLEKYLAVTRRSLDKMGPGGNFPVALPEAWAPYPSVRSSYYDSKAFVAYIPALTARLAALQRKELARKEIR